MVHNAASVLFHESSHAVRAAQALKCVSKTLSDCQVLVSVCVNAPGRLTRHVQRREAICSSLMLRYVSRIDAACRRSSRVCCYAYNAEYRRRSTQKNALQHDVTVR